MLEDILEVCGGGGQLQQDQEGRLIKDVLSLYVFEDSLGLKLHLFEDFRPRK